MPTDRLSALHRIASDLQPVEDGLILKWRKFIDYRTESQSAYEDLVEHCALANRSIERRVREIAQLLRMTDAQIQAFRPDAPHRVVDPTRVWFHDSRPASFIRYAGLYGSANEIDWRRGGWSGYPRLDRAEALAPQVTDAIAGLRRQMSVDAARSPTGSG